MTDDDLERVLRDAFDAKARTAVGDTTAPRPLDVSIRRVRPFRHRSSWLAPLAAAAVVAALAAGLVVAFRGQLGGQDVVAGHATKIGTATPTIPGRSTAAPSSAPATTLTTPVHVALKFSDGSQFGVGIPIIAYLSRKITDARPFAAATVVTVNGRPAAGAWYFESSGAQPGYPLEAHYRLQGYWPAHSKISMELPVKGLSAGKGLAFDDSLTLAFSTGAANIATVDDTTHTLTLVSDGTSVGTFPVSLGATNTPTRRGTKVIMERGASICMTGPGYHECNVQWTQRLTYDGEYLHAAPWNIANLGHFDSSNGCTNLSTADAARLYKLLEIGDVVQYANASGPAMRLGDGYGDWNVSWPQWLTGGALATR